MSTISTLFSLAGKAAIVLGGTGGLGQAMTQALAEAGADIVSIELPNDPQSENLKKLVEETGRKHAKFHCDIKNAKELRAVFAKIWEAGVIPDILLNSAGIQRRGKVEDISDEDLDDVHSALEYMNYNVLTNPRSWTSTSKQHTLLARSSASNC